LSYTGRAKSLMTIGPDQKKAGKNSLKL